MDEYIRNKMFRIFREDEERLIKLAYALVKNEEDAKLVMEEATIEILSQPKDNLIDTSFRSYMQKAVYRTAKKYMLKTHESPTTNDVRFNLDEFKELEGQLSGTKSELIEWVRKSMDGASDFYLDQNTLQVSIDPGTAPNEEIASILSDLSNIYRKLRGSGISFKPDSITVNQEEAYEL